MRQLFILKKEFTTEDNIPVINRKGDLQYTVKRIEENNKTSFIILDYMNKEVASVHGESQDDRDHIEVLVDDKCLFSVKQSQALTEDAFQMIDSELDLYGDWRTLDFDINSGYRKVAKVRNRWISFGDSLELTVFEESSELVSLGILVAAESLYLKEVISYK